jgi:hypothetical protein
MPITTAARRLFDTVNKGLMRSFGDAGASPANKSGVTLLKRVDEIKGEIKSIQDPLYLGLGLWSGYTFKSDYLELPSSSTDVYQVPSGKDAYVRGLWLEVTPHASSVSLVYVAHTDSSNADINPIFRMKFLPGGDTRLLYVPLGLVLDSQEKIRGQITNAHASVSSHVGYTLMEEN